MTGRAVQEERQNKLLVRSLPFDHGEYPQLQRVPQRSVHGSILVSIDWVCRGKTYVMLVLQLRRLNLLKLLRQSRHDDCGRRGGEESKKAMYWDEKEGCLAVIKIVKEKK